MSAPTSEQALIARYVEEDPNHEGDPAEYRLKHWGVHVWALAGYYRAGEAIESIARGYDLPDEAVTAAMAYYRNHRQQIDCRIAENVSEPVG